MEEKEMTNEYKRTLCDIDIILNELKDEEKNMIPLKLRNIIHDNRLEGYQSQIRTDIPIEQQQLHPDTQAFLAMLYLNYWCKDENEKKELRTILVDNEEKFQKELSEKYDVYNVFKQRQEKTINNTEEENEETQMIIYKESLIKKILNKIFALFRRK
jgi:hypothetical protein